MSDAHPFMAAIIAWLAIISGTTYLLSRRIEQLEATIGKPEARGARAKAPR